MRFRGALLLAVVVGLLPGLGVFEHFASAPPLIVVVAVVPAIAWAMLLLLVDRFEREPPLVVAAMVLWGAVAALLALAGNQMLEAGLASWLSPQRAEVLTPTVGGPVIEESLKAVGLLPLLALRRRELDDRLDGLVYGALIGLGFAMTENVVYFLIATLQGGLPGLTRAVYLRSFLQGLNHAAFTATAGVALGITRERRSRRGAFALPLAGFVAACLQHVAWNSFASGAIESALCGVSSPQGVCRPSPAAGELLVTVPLIVLLFVGPGAALLCGMAVSGLRRQARIFARELAPELGAGLFSEAELRGLGSVGGRWRREWRGFRASGPRGWAAVREFDDVATALALFRHRSRLAQGHPEDAACGVDVSTEAILLARLASAREQLSSR